MHCMRSEKTVISMEILENYACYHFVVRAVDLRKILLHGGIHDDDDNDVDAAISPASLS